MIASTVPPSMSGDILISGEVKVLLVSVSVVALPTSVSVASGKVIVRSAVGLPGVNVSSFASADEPSKIKSVVIVEFIAIVSVAASPIVVFPVAVKESAVMVPVAVMLRNPLMSLLESTTTPLDAVMVPAVTSVKLVRSTAESIWAPVKLSYNLPYFSSVKTSLKWLNRLHYICWPCAIFTAIALCLVFFSRPIITLQFKQRCAHQPFNVLRTAIADCFLIFLRALLQR